MSVLSTWPYNNFYHWLYIQFNDAFGIIGLLTILAHVKGATSTELEYTIIIFTGLAFIVRLNIILVEKMFLLRWLKLLASRLK